jgi:hypothetical protein
MGSGRVASIAGFVGCQELWTGLGMTGQEYPGYGVRCAGTVARGRPAYVGRFGWVGLVRRFSDLFLGRDLALMRGI